MNLRYKVKTEILDFGDWVIDHKLVTIAAVFILFVITVSLYWWNSPQQQVSRADHTLNSVIAKKKVYKKAPSNRSFTYDPQTQTPDFQTLINQRKDSSSLVTRSELVIPNLRINVPVFEGVNPHTLAWGVGTAKKGEQLGRKNYAIEGHNYIKLSQARNWFFSNLQKNTAPRNTINTKYLRITRGTKIFVTDNSHVYEYDVDNVQIRDIRNLASAYLLDDSQVNLSGDKKPLLTIATCYEQQGVSHPNQRIIVIAKLQSMKNKGDFPLFKKYFTLIA